MMDQSDPRLRQAIAQLDKAWQCKSVDHEEGAGRNCLDGLRRAGVGQLVRLRKTTRELVHLYRPAERAQTFDNPSVVDVPAGPLSKWARYDEVQRRCHPAWSPVS